MAAAGPQAQVPVPPGVPPHYGRTEFVPPQVPTGKLERQDGRAHWPAVASASSHRIYLTAAGLPWLGLTLATITSFIASVGSGRFSYQSVSYFWDLGTWYLDGPALAVCGLLLPLFVFGGLIGSFMTIPTSNAVRARALGWAVPAVVLLLLNWALAHRWGGSYSRWWYIGGPGWIYTLPAGIGMACVLGTWFTLRMRPGRVYWILSVPFLYLILCRAFGLDNASGFWASLIPSRSPIVAFALLIPLAWLAARSGTISPTKALPPTGQMIFMDGTVDPRPAFQPGGWRPVNATNSLAIIAFVLTWFVGLAGIICGHIALSQIKRSGEQGRGLAIAALVLGYVWLVAFVAVLTALNSAAARY